MIFTFALNKLADFVAWVSTFLIQHLPPASIVVPSWFATGAHSISLALSLINIFLPLDLTVQPALVAVFVIDGGFALIIAINWILRKIPGIN